MYAYTVSSGGVTIANAVVTLVFVNPAAAPTFALDFTRAWVSQSANATSAQQRVQLNTQVTAFPTLTAATPAKVKTHGPASGIAGGTAGAAGTAGIDATAEGAGAKTIIWPDAFNVLNGWLWRADEDEIISLVSGSASGFGLHLPVAAATLTDWAFGVVFRER